MRILIALILASFLPTLSMADTIAFTFNGFIDNGDPNIPNVWTGPGPEPTTFQMTFDVNTLDPSNSVNYTFGPNGQPLPSLNSITAEFVATNFALTVDGSPVLRSATASFGFAGTPLGSSSFIGGFYSAGAGTGNQAVSFSGVPDFGLGTTSQAALLASSDPLSLLLNGSSFFTDDFAFFNYEGNNLESEVSGGGVLVATVPEPGTLALLALATVVLGFAHRHHLRGMIARHTSRTIDGGS